MEPHAKQDTAIITVITALAAILVLALFSKSVEAAGLLKPKNGNQSMVTMQSHDVRVTINNGFARTEVDQVFANNGEHDLEAVYTFPLPRKASLSEVSLWIDGREVVGEVLEKRRAREVYEDQKSKGNTTAIAEKKEYKSFDVSVYPVVAGGETRVRLVYYQPLSVDLNVGRYLYPLQEGGVDEERLAFWSVDGKVSGAFSFELELKSSYPVKDIRLPGYMQQAVIEQLEGDESGSGIHRIRIDVPRGAALERDVVFYYRLDDTVPARVELLPYKTAGSKEGTFMLTVTPGASLQPIEEGVDYTFVLDKSGSMSGAKIATLVDGMSRVISNLSPDDRFRIVVFNDNAMELTNGYISMNSAVMDEVLAAVKTLVPGGGTAMHAGLALGLDKIDEKRTSALILVTDGVANVGPTQHKDFLRLVQEKDLRLFTFIVGNSGNTPLLKRLALASGGFATSISPQDDIYGRILQVKNKMLYEAFHDVEVRFSGGEVAELTPAAPGTLYRGEQLVMFGKYRQPGEVRLALTAKISGERREWDCDFTLPVEDLDNPEIERLWALSAIEEVMDEVRLHGESETLIGEIVSLGAEYSLVTEYTSMVVLNDAEAEQLGIQRRNAGRVAAERAAQQQRSSLPPTGRRVDNSGDGGMFQNVPAPSLGTGSVGGWWLLVLLVSGISVKFGGRKRNCKR